MTTTTKLVGSMKLILTDNANKYHLYIINHCVFDPNTPVNILVVPALGPFLVIMKMQMILLQRMEPPSNMVPQINTSFGIMEGMIGILCMDLSKCQNYISMLVMDISQLSAPGYISYFLKNCTSLFPQTILLHEKLVM